MAIAPPFTLILLVSQPITLFTAIAWATNASLISIKSRSALTRSGCAETSRASFRVMGRPAIV